jgi:hypothetical protein
MPVPSPLAAVTRGGARAERLELRPGDVGVDAAAEAAVRRGDDAVGADDVGEPADALRDELGCSTTFVAWLTTPGTSTRSSGTAASAHAPNSCSWRTLRRLERDRADVRLQHDGQDVLQLDVGGVGRATSPAQVQAHLLLGRPAIAWLIASMRIFVNAW